MAGRIPGKAIFTSGARKALHSCLKDSAALKPYTSITAISAFSSGSYAVMLRRAYRTIRAWALRNDSEERQLECFLTHLGLNGSSRIADVGCGYGRILRLLSECGLNAVGVEVNPVIANKNRSEG